MRGLPFKKEGDRPAPDARRRAFAGCGIAAPEVGTPTTGRRTECSTRSWLLPSAKQPASRRVRPGARSASRNSGTPP